ncbi:glycosyltransferase [Flavobacterium sp. 17A]|uniref:Glycosyltransferase n=1 Tax=Flavobacterium potami TaxID=2872310 RepID=A0A9X1HDF7_9FLAO|nr:glycosyltransferase [Flavobacterium potami]MBZ4036587.1 glycosyltransferase [Flavobacterium potami]
MKFAIITHVVHIQKDNQYFGYSPYVREMNIWLKYVDEVIIVAPLSFKEKVSEIDSCYDFKGIDFRAIPNFNLTSLANVLSSIFKLPLIFWKIFWTIKAADHVHLRCPGNVGLIGCLVQMFFPKKIKIAKYAGNWDPKSKQPFTYRLQKWILNNTFLTRNMQVLVYGEWENTTKNIKPFFTASYAEKDKLPIQKLDIREKINFVFVGTLSPGKNSLYAIQLVEDIRKQGYDSFLELYGEGPERKTLEDYIIANQLEKYISLMGNQNQQKVTQAYQNSHFVILPSKSEGWPKALAEGMFWGCIPIATAISCVPFMLDYGERGLLLNKELKSDSQQLKDILNSTEHFNLKREKASEWSRKYTLDTFETEIKKMIKE